MCHESSPTSNFTLGCGRNATTADEVKTQLLTVGSFDAERRTDRVLSTTRSMTSGGTFENDITDATSAIPETPVTFYGLLVDEIDKRKSTFDSVIECTLFGYVIYNCHLKFSWAVSFIPASLKLGQFGGRASGTTNSVTGGKEGLNNMGCYKAL